MASSRATELRDRILANFPALVAQGKEGFTPIRGAIFSGFTFALPPDLSDVTDEDAKSVVPSIIDHLTKNTLPSIDGIGPDQELTVYSEYIGRSAAGLEYSADFLLFAEPQGKPKKPRIVSVLEEAEAWYKNGAGLPLCPRTFPGEDDTPFDPDTHSFTADLQAATECTRTLEALLPARLGDDSVRLHMEPDNLSLTITLARHRVTKRKIGDDGSGRSAKAE